MIQDSIAGKGYSENRIAITLTQEEKKATTPAQEVKLDINSSDSLNRLDSKVVESSRFNFSELEKSLHEVSESYEQKVEKLRKSCGYTMCCNSHNKSTGVASLAVGGAFFCFMIGAAISLLSRLDNENFKEELEEVFGEHFQAVITSMIVSLLATSVSLVVLGKKKVNVSTGLKNSNGKVENKELHFLKTKTLLEK